MNGPSASEGKVVMCLNGVWGSFCPSSLDNNDAKVVCYQLGYSPKGKHSNSNWTNYFYCSFLDHHTQVLWLIETIMLLQVILFSSRVYHVKEVKAHWSSVLLQF